MLKWGGGWRAATCQPTPNLNLEYDYVKVGGRLAGRHLPANPPPTYALLPGNMPPILAWPDKFNLWAVYRGRTRMSDQSSDQSSDDQGDCMTLKDLAEIVKDAKAKVYDSPGASYVRMSYLNICDTEDWSHSTPMPTLQFSNATRCI